MTKQTSKKEAINIALSGICLPISAAGLAVGWLVGAFMYGLNRGMKEVPKRAPYWRDGNFSGEAPNAKTK